MPSDKIALNSPKQVDERQVTDWSDMISWKKHRKQNVMGPSECDLFGGRALKSQGKRWSWVLIQYDLCPQKKTEKAA